MSDVAVLPAAGRRLSARSGAEITILRIYLIKREASDARAGFLARMFAKPYSFRLAERARKFGVSHVIVTQACAGYMNGDDRLSVQTLEIPCSDLPTCVEIIAHDSVVDRFLEDQREGLLDAIIVKIAATVW